MLHTLHTLAASPARTLVVDETVQCVISICKEALQYIKSIWYIRHNSLASITFHGAVLAVTQNQLKLVRML